jgi:N-acetylglucosamine-6-sulfatase
MQMKTASLCIFLLIAMLSQQSFSQCVIEKPVPFVSSHSSCDITMSWNAVDGATYYKVRYKVNSATTWIRPSEKIYGNVYTFTGLDPNVTYRIAVAAYCSDDKSPGGSATIQTTDGCSVPTSFNVTDITDSSLMLSWGNHCSTTSYNVQYKESSSESWTTINEINSTNFIVNNLLSNTSYDFSVQGQNGGSVSDWSPVITANTAEEVITDGTTDDTTVATIKVLHPNILIYLLDDARYDPFQPNGGPSWFNTPSINRIADEGINVRYAFPTTSQCGPSRISYYSGQYASKHGAINNTTKHLPGIPLISQILKDAGYYTGLIGKYGNLQGKPEGFSWWATSAGDEFVDASYKINGLDTIIDGHITDVYQNLAYTFMNNVPEGQPFLLFFNSRIPHTPTTPRDQDLSLFVDEQMPFPNNFSRYTVNYPSYFYSTDDHEWLKDVLSTNNTKLKDFQCLYGAEVNMQGLLDYLTAKGILDSTIIIFTSDNGFLEGEHKLSAKVIAQEESIRLPMFIRFPSWFEAGTIDSTVIVSNIDIPVTILDAVGIPDTFGMDGTSIRQLLNGEAKREYFYYQYAGDDNTPAIRAVRSIQYKYIRHYCTEATEEFYDLANDPHENVNQINNSQFESLVNNYRNALDSIKNSLNDSDPGLFTCSLSNPQYQKQTESEEEINVGILDVYPNPGSKYFSVSYADEEREDIEVWITNILDQPVYYKAFPNSNTFNVNISCSNLPQGNYLVRMKKGDKTYNTKFIIQN